MPCSAARLTAGRRRGEIARIRRSSGHTAGRSIAAGATGRLLGRAAPLLAASGVTIALTTDAAFVLIGTATITAFAAVSALLNATLGLSVVAVPTGVGLPAPATVAVIGLANVDVLVLESAPLALFHRRRVGVPLRAQMNVRVGGASILAPIGVAISAVVATGFAVIPPLPTIAATGFNAELGVGFLVLSIVGHGHLPHLTPR